MKTGIILGLILGIVLLIVSGVAFFSAKMKGKNCKWCFWVALGGVCALLTAAVNALCFI